MLKWHMDCVTISLLKENAFSEMLNLHRFPISRLKLMAICYENCPTCSANLLYFFSVKSIISVTPSLTYRKTNWLSLPIMSTVNVTIYYSTYSSGKLHEATKTFLNDKLVESFIENLHQQVINHQSFTRLFFLFLIENTLIYLWHYVSINNIEFMINSLINN